MPDIADIAALETLYGTPKNTAMAKVADRLTPTYRRWIMASRFCILSTVGPEGTDASPRGDDGPVVTEVDDRTLLLPDWRGNDRIDSLRNIVRDPRVSLMFMVPGSTNVIRVNGAGAVTTDDLARFGRRGVQPRSAIRIRIAEVYFQCSRALVRSALWKGDADEGLPTAGEMIAANEAGFDGAAYDAEWTERARKTMW